MRLRDAFLVLVAAVSVMAASVVVAAVSAGNRDWDLLVPLLALSLAGSIVTILATLYLSVTDSPAEPAPAPDSATEESTGAPAGAETADTADAAEEAEEATLDPETPTPGTTQTAPTPGTTQTAPAPEQPDPKPPNPGRGFGGPLPHWVALALNAVFLLAILVAALVVARILVVSYADLRPSENTVALFTAVAWGVLVIGLVALFLATPSVEEADTGGAGAIRRVRAVAEVATAVAVAGAAMVAFGWIRDSVGDALLPGVVSVLVGIAAAAATLIALRVRGTGAEAPNDRAASTGSSGGAPPPPPTPSMDLPALLPAPRAAPAGTTADRMRSIVAQWIAGAIAIVSLVPGFLAITTLTLFFIVVELHAKNGLVDAVVDSISGFLGVAHSQNDAAVRVAIVIIGPPLGLAAWLVVGLVAGRVASIDRANIEAYQALRMRALAIRTALGIAPVAPGTAPGTGGAPSTPEAMAARAAARAQLESTVLSLNGGDPVESNLNWVTGSGYVALWRKVHRAEEAEMLFSPLSDVLEAAKYDQARLDGSSMKQQKSLVDRLTVAKATIEAAMGLAPAPPAGQPAPPIPNDAQQLGARLELQSISGQINAYKDDASDELVKVRRRISQSTVWTGVVAYLLLLLVIIVGMPANLIAAASGLYLIAALAGLLQRINKEIDVNAGVEDYGVTTARLFLAPLVSGLAGVAGVALIAILGAPSGLLPQNAAGTASLGDAFNLSKYPFALVLAAAFGLAPAALFNRLQGISDQLKGAISSTDSGKGSNSGG